MKRILQLTVLISIAFLSADLFSEINDDPVLLIGSSPQYVIKTWGIPDEIQAQRAEKQQWDTVVFYRAGFYVYWVQNIVWQLRFDSTCTEQWKGIKIGTLYPIVDNILGRPMHIENNVRVYNILGYQYPIQIRGYFKDDKLNDIYIYRSNS